jgi:hypothetical protein
MKRSAHRDLDLIAQACSTKPRGHVVYLMLNESTDEDEAIEARKREMIAAGKAGPHDNFVFYLWICPEPDAQREHSS